MKKIINLGADTGLVDRSENTTRFYKDIRHYKTLTREEEVEWFTRMRDPSLTQAERDYAREFIIKSNQRLVIAAAKNYSTTETLMDFTNEANFGLMEAIEDFNPNLGNKFISFAMWYIKRAINAYRNGDCQVVKRPNITKTFHVMSKAQNDFLQDNERMPTSEELFNIINDKYKKNIRDKNDLNDIHYSSIDRTADDDDDASIGTITEYNVASASCNGYEYTEKKEYDEKLVNSLLKTLGDREQTIVKMLFGLYDDGKGLKREYELSEIAEKVGLTKERVRQLRDSSLKALKKAYIAKINRL